jgi:hypothetical protein
MGLEHLQDNRTGRPKGSKNSPAWARAARWAARNLNRPDAVPPSALAEGLAALGCESPDRLLACLALADAVEQRPEWASGQCQPKGREPEEAPLGSGAESKKPRGRVKKLRVTESLLAASLSGRRHRWITNLPPDFRIVACEREAGGEAIVLTLRAEGFPLVPEGQDVPELEPDFAYQHPS